MGKRSLRVNRGLDMIPPMAYFPEEGTVMIFVETPVLTRQVPDFLSEEQYRDVQDELRKHPDLGSKIKGSGGLRKLRWGMEGQGKSGGVRIVYYWVVSQDRILMIYLYPKSKQADLSPEQLRVLKRTVEKELL